MAVPSSRTGDLFRSAHTSATPANGGCEYSIDAQDRIHRIDSYRISEAEWARNLGVETTPTLLFMTSSGNVRAIHTGFVSPEVLVAVIDELILSKGH